MFKNSSLLLWLRCGLATASFWPLLAFAQQTPSATSRSAERLVGTWQLESFVEERPNGEMVASTRYGAKVRGLIVYDSSGNMAAQLMNPERPHFATDRPAQGTAEEIKTAFVGYNAYFGTYTLDESTATIRHRVNANLFPNLVGTEFTRKFKLEGDVLTLELPPAQIQGERRTARLVWRRMR